MKRILFIAIGISLLMLACSSGSTDSGYTPPDYVPSETDGDDTENEIDEPVIDPDGDSPEVDGDPEPEIEEESVAEDGDVLEEEVETEEPVDGDDDPDITDPFVDVYKSTGPIYEPGSLVVDHLELARGDEGNEFPMLIYYPRTTGMYAVIVFHHGFLLSNAYYGDIFEFLASHGFIIVAPQMHDANSLPTGKPSTYTEASSARDIYDWLPGKLTALTGSIARTDLLGLAGHSRGGKVSWINAKHIPNMFRAIAGLDPVDGTVNNTEPRVLDSTIPFVFPSLIIGTGKGPQEFGFPAQACAPEGDNHVQFYTASNSPAYHVVATAYGHNDILNDETPGCILYCTMCPEGPSRRPMRSLASGMLLALFRATLQGKTDDFAALYDEDNTPGVVELEHK